jgi:hypothetical protein
VQCKWLTETLCYLNTGRARRVSAPPRAPQIAPEIGSESAGKRKRNSDPEMQKAKGTIIVIIVIIDNSFNFIVLIFILLCLLVLLTSIHIIMIIAIMHVIHIIVIIVIICVFNSNSESKESVLIETEDEDETKTVADSSLLVPHNLRENLFRDILMCPLVLHAESSTLV